MTTHRSAKILAATVIAALLAVPGVATAAPAPAQGDAAIQQAVDAVVASGGPSVLARVTRDGVVTDYRAGTAVLGTDRPVPLDGRFRVGSVTKMLTSTVLLQLVAAGKVDLDAPVARYLPGLLPDGDAITVRMIMQLTSGLYDYSDDLPSDAKPSDTPTLLRERFDHYNAAELVAGAAAKPLLFTPGTNWSYSNTNYLVAGMLISEVTGQSWGQQVTERIIDPLRLRGTFVPGDFPLIPQPHADGYLMLGTTPVDITALNPSIAGSAGALLSTAADLDHFLTALLGGQLLPPAQLAEMTGTDAFTHAYGLGLERLALPCGITVWGHTGGIYGYSTVAFSTMDGSRRVELSLTEGSGPSEASAEALVNATLCD